MQKLIIISIILSILYGCHKQHWLKDYYHYDYMLISNSENGNKRIWKDLNGNKYDVSLRKDCDLFVSKESMEQTLFNHTYYRNGCGRERILCFILTDNVKQEIIEHRILWMPDDFPSEYCDTLSNIVDKIEVNYNHVERFSIYPITIWFNDI